MPPPSGKLVSEIAPEAIFGGFPSMLRVFLLVCGRLLVKRHLLI